MLTNLAETFSFTMKQLLFLTVNLNCCARNIEFLKLEPEENGEIKPKN